MDKKENIQETKNLLGGGKTYKDEIIKIVNETENLKYLEFLYKLLLSFKKKWGV